MSEVDATAGDGSSAGAQLRAAREAQGLHIAVLAASIKVPQAKLESLEGDRYDELPDVAFTRALAQTVCRALKIDAEPVLAKLPQAGGHRLEPIGGGLNTPFRERPARLDGRDWSRLNRPVAWIVALLLLATVVLFLLPESLWSRVSATDEATTAVVVRPVALPQAAPAASPPQVVVETVHPPADAPAVEASASAPVAGATTPLEAPTASPAGIAVLRATGETWVQVVDAHERLLLGRTLQAGDTVGVDGVPPLRVTIGNANATELLFKGKPVDLSRRTRDNVARIELK